MQEDKLRVLIVSEHASARFGGEAALPLHYYRVLRSRGYPVWLVTHARTRGELSSLFPGDDHISYVEDSWLHRLMWRIGDRLPAQISYFTTGFISRVSVQLVQRALVRRLIAAHGIGAVHQPMPVSPREPSLMYGFGVPVVIGPMNGGMDYPPAFRGRRGLLERTLLAAGRWSSSFLNRLMPGKRRAALLLVANQRTRAALPAGLGPDAVEMVENGVDVSLWTPEQSGGGLTRESAVPPTFAFVGRLVDWKSVDVLLHAFSRIARNSAMRLLIIGDGPERPRLEALAAQLQLPLSPQDGTGGIHFAGWLSQQECARRLQGADCLLLPSLLECGGAVVLEAMSMGKPVIATAWGGPADYIDDSCGILVPPTDRAALIQGFADAMTRLAASRRSREELGRNGRLKVLRQYDWDVKVDRMIGLYRQAQSRARDHAARSSHGDARGDG